MDPRDMINQIRSDFESKRWTGFVLAGILALGLAAWCRVISTRAFSPGAISPAASADRQQISVLTDPFAAEQK